MKTDRIYTGTNFGHSSAVCLLNDSGELEFAVEEESLINVKHTDNFPFNGIQLILDRSGGRDLHWSEGWNINRRFLQKGLLHSLKYISDSNYLKFRLRKEWNRLLEARRQYKNIGKFRFIGHHISHAYSLIPFGLPMNTLIMVSDTLGEGESVSFYHWNGKMTLLRSINYPHSPGSVFHQFAYHLGFSGRTGPGKLMALAGFGKPVWLNELNEIGTIKNGIFRINLNRYPAFRLKDATNRFLRKLKPSPFKTEFLNCLGNYEMGKDIASSIQEWFKTTSWQLISDNIAYARNVLKLSVDHLALSGGSALNCQANGFFSRNLNSLDIESLVVSPWSEDAGTAIGAAVGNALRINPDWCSVKSDPFLGPYASAAKTNIIDLNDQIEEAALSMLNGEILALVSGRLEFGPRALGGRCILANAFDGNVKFKLNALKGRPGFMPFAPAILEEDYDKVFNGKGSEVMAWTVEGKSDAIKTIPGAFHVTGEARAQIVSSKSLILYKFLKRIKQQRGIGICLLTSLNGSGQPMPVTLSDARTICKEIGIKTILSDRGLERTSISFHSKIDDRISVNVL